MVLVAWGPISRSTSDLADPALPPSRSELVIDTATVDRPPAPAVDFPDPVLASTFSILAIDPETGEVGVATQSKIVAVGAIVPFAQAGAGAVASQAYANSTYGPLALRELANGTSVPDVLELLVRGDPLRERRQVALISPEGHRIAHTGDSCLPWAGSLEGVDCITVGNLLVGREVLEAMVHRFEETEGVLAERLLAALHAGDAAGGDRRGRQSAALLVVRESWGYGGLGDRFRDLRVDDSESPIESLEAVYQKHRALFPRPDDETRQ